MARPWIVVIAIGLTAAAGCTMCANPYDQCGPLDRGGCAEQCGSRPRAGSILSSAPSDVVADPQIAPDHVGSSALDQQVDEPIQPPVAAQAPSSAREDGWKPSAQQKPSSRPAGS